MTSPQSPAPASRPDTIVDVDHPDYVPELGEVVRSPTPRPEGEELGDLDMSMLRDQVGFATHGAWKRWRVEQGYPDHALIHGSGPIDCLRCERSWSVHHEDMIDWSGLSETKRQKYIVMGMAGREV